MRLSSQLNNDAQRYASKLARESLFEHDTTNRGQGENLGLQCAPGSDADLVKKVVDAWLVWHLALFLFSCQQSVQSVIKQLLIQVLLYPLSTPPIAGITKFVTTTSIMGHFRVPLVTSLKLYGREAHSLA